LRGFDIRTVSPIVFVPTPTTTAVAYTNPQVLDSGGRPTSATVNIPTLSYQTSFPGGDTELVANFEYRIPLFPHVAMSFFGDAGATGDLRQNQLQLNSTEFASLTQQFPLTSINRTLQLQPGTNFKPRTSAGIELVVQLPIVQAPFRIYWAYNFNRMSEVITAPSTQFPGNVANVIASSTLCDPSKQITTNCFDPNWTSFSRNIPETVWNGQVVPQILNLFNNPQRTNFFDPVRTFRFTVSRTF
jgi:hypothetical protein